VIDSRDNLLGRSFFDIFSCVLDLNEEQLIIGRMNKCLTYTTIERVVTINGKEIEVNVDTGSNFFLAGSLEAAQELDLALEDISHLNIEYRGINKDSVLQYQAKEVCLKAFGRETYGDFELRPSELEISGLTMGLLALHGLVLRFGGHG